MSAPQLLALFMCLELLFSLLLTVSECSMLIYFSLYPDSFALCSIGSVCLSLSHFFPCPDSLPPLCFTGSEFPALAFLLCLDISHCLCSPESEFFLFFLPSSYFLTCLSTESECPSLADFLPISDFLLFSCLIESVCLHILHFCVLNSHFSHFC